jgi:hypothetical protein
VRGLIPQARGPYGLSTKRVKPSHIRDAFCDVLLASSLVFVFFFLDKDVILIGLWYHSPFSFSFLL